MRCRVYGNFLYYFAIFCQPKNTFTLKFYLKINKTTSVSRPPHRKSEFSGEDRQGGHDGAGGHRQTKEMIDISVTPPAMFFFLKIALAIQGLS